MKNEEFKQRDLMGMEEVAAKLDISRGALRRMVYRDEIPYYKLGKMYKFDSVELEKWIQSRRGK